MADMMTQAGACVEDPLALNAEAPFMLSDDEILDLWRDEIKKECFEHRYVFERQWMRNIYYILGRQWIEYYGRNGGWRHNRAAPGPPQAAANKGKEKRSAIRALFT